MDLASLERELCVTFQEGDKWAFKLISGFTFAFHGTAWNSLKSVCRFGIHPKMNSILKVEPELIVSCSVIFKCCFLFDFL